MFITRWYYRRVATEPPKYLMYHAEFLGFLMWYWILYHIWKEPEHITVSNIWLLYIYALAFAKCTDIESLRQIRNIKDIRKSSH